MIAELATRRKAPPRHNLRVVSDAPTTSEPQQIPKGPAAFILFGKHKETTLLPYHSDPEVLNPKPKELVKLVQMEFFDSPEISKSHFTHPIEIFPNHHQGIQRVVQSELDQLSLTS